MRRYIELESVNDYELMPETFLFNKFMHVARSAVGDRNKFNFACIVIDIVIGFR